MSLLLVKNNSKVLTQCNSISGLPNLFLPRFPWQVLQIAPGISASIFLVALDWGSLAGDIPGLVTLGGGASSKILTSLSSPELSELLEELSSSELSSLDESELELENGN